MSTLNNNAEKVTANGSGLHRARLGEAASFTINAGSAGRGYLAVGLEGAVIPVKEVVMKHQGNNAYHVSYELEERGDYILNILWGGSHIPGSPFHVSV